MYHVSIKQQFKGWDTEGIDTECTGVGTSALYPQVILDPQYSHRVRCISVITVMGQISCRGIYLVVMHTQMEGPRNLNSAYLVLQHQTYCHCVT